MKTKLYFNGIPAQFCPETLAVHCNEVPVAPGETVSVCAWCDIGRLLTTSLTLAGYKVSHTICQDCKNEFASRQGASFRTYLNHDTIRKN